MTSMAVPHCARVITPGAKSTWPTNITHKPPQRRCLPLSVHSARPPLSCQRAAFSFHCVLNWCVRACVCVCDLHACWSVLLVSTRSGDKEKKALLQIPFHAPQKENRFIFYVNRCYKSFLNELKAKTAEYSPEETLAFLPSPSSLFHLHRPALPPQLNEWTCLFYYCSTKCYYISPKLSHRSAWLDQLDDLKGARSTRRKPRCLNAVLMAEVWNCCGLQGRSTEATPRLNITAPKGPHGFIDPYSTVYSKSFSVDSWQGAAELGLGDENRRVALQRHRIISIGFENALWGNVQ